MGNCFCAVYPCPPNKVKTDEAHTVRNICFVATLMHLGLAIVGVFATGTVSLVINLCMALWIMSAYFNMIEKITWIYMTLLLL